jgi:DNA modification methylase
MGKKWDSSVPGLEWALACLRVLKPGGHIVAFGGTRTVHRLAVALEDAGFELRDMIAWAQYQGFPKSLNASKAIDGLFGAEREVVGSQKMTGGGRKGKNNNRIGAGRTNAADPVERVETIIDITAPATPEAKLWDGYGTGLKPSYEPAILARKPLAESSIARQLLATGTGALNIDGCRFPYGDPCWIGPSESITGERDRANGKARTPGHGWRCNPHINPASDLGRWPANIYQCPKPSRGEREAGCEELESVTGAEAVNREPGSPGMGPRSGAGRTAAEIRNNHPTVKPLGVMRWLCRLVGGQPGSLILDPFAGSGTTIMAATLEGFRAIGIEREARYVEIARARSRWAREEFMRERAQLELPW